MSWADVGQMLGSWADDMVQVAKNEMGASEVCFACLTWLYGLLVVRQKCTPNGPSTLPSASLVKLRFSSSLGRFAGL